MIPLEDFFNDVVGKAQRGLGLTDSALAQAAGVTVAELQALKGGAVDEAVLEKLAGPLNLHAAALQVMARQSWLPRPIEMAGLAQFNTPYDDMTVNAYVVWDPVSKKAAAFDTGADASGMMAFIKNYDLSLDYVFITHTHGDHIADLATLRAGLHGGKMLSHALEPAPGTETFSLEAHPGWTLGALSIEPRPTHGHARAGITFVVTGLAHPVAVVGDALFASSMGGGMVSYADALATNRASIFSLPDDTILCPGHGPLTTVAEEKQHNPFYPEFKAAQN
ncbi:MAG: MBL fold metallo-hydrolase [Verrucomicrobiales bacterium]|nr:MBL fold metallo-hydrolase [Verrucomicrobiales bacterium]